MLFGYNMLKMYSNYFSRTVYDLPLSPTEEDRFDMNYSLARKTVADAVINMFEEEFNISAKSKSNPKYQSKIFKGELLFVIANNIYALYNYCHLNYMVLNRERTKAYEHKREFLNLSSKEANDVMVNNWSMQVEAVLEIMTILFGKNFDNIASADYYSKETYEKYSFFVNTLKVNPIWPDFRREDTETQFLNKESDEKERKYGKETLCAGRDRRKSKIFL